MIKDKERRLNVGDIVSVKGEKEFFEITDWFYECSYNNIDGWYERSNFTLKGQKSGKFIDLIREDDKNIQLEERSSKPMQPLPSGRFDVGVTTIDNKDEEKSLEFSLDYYSKPLTKDETDFLLDKYNTLMNIHLLIKYMGVEETESRDLATEIMEYLSSS